LTLKNKKIKKIAITGPESTGKSTLARQLADHYNTVWIHEFARSYIDQLDHPYEKKDLLKIAKGQINGEEMGDSNANKLLFCDTELLVIKIWSMYKYGTVHPKILSEIKKRSYDLYLLADIDLPWEYDSQREHPENRVYFFKWFERELKALNANYHIIHGNRRERLTNSIRIIDTFLRKKSIENP